MELKSFSYKSFFICVCITFLITGNLTVYSSYSEQEHKKNPLILFDDNEHPKTALQELLRHIKIKHGNTVHSIVEATQKRYGEGGLLRPAGTERWTFPDITLPSLVRPFYLQCLGELGFLNRIMPRLDPHDYKNLFKPLDYAVFFGGRLEDIRKRLSFLLDLWQLGIRFKTLVILTGDRPRDPHIENQNTLSKSPYRIKPGWQLNKMPSAEAEIITCVFEQTELPHEWQSLEKMIINTPTQKNAHGTLQRPNTTDTINHWISTKPQPGSILPITNLPYFYQIRALENQLPSTFKVIMAIAGHSSIAINMRDTFDAIGRLAWEERNMIHNKQKQQKTITMTAKL
jgi:hypothetical protein